MSWKKIEWTGIFLNRVFLCLLTILAATAILLTIVHITDILGSGVFGVVFKLFSGKDLVINIDGSPLYVLGRLFHRGCT